MSSDTTKNDPKKRGLGRGLDALFRDVKSEEEAFAPKVKRADEIVAASKVISESAPSSGPSFTGVKKLPVEKLTPGKFQPRRSFDETALDQLSDSVAVHGILQPLLVRPISNSMYEIIAGERRWRAAQRAQVHDVPVIIKDLTDKEALEVALIENLQREDLTAIEEAEGYQRLMDEFGYTQETLSQHLGKSRSYIANSLRLLKLPNGVCSMIQKGSLSAGHARVLIGAQNPLALAEKIIKEGLSVRQVERLIRRAAEGKVKTIQQSVYEEKDVDVLAIENSITSLLGLKVTIKGNTKGVISIAYKNLDQLDDVIKRLSRRN